MKAKNNFFQFKHFRINQARAAMKVSTEACILGGYCQQENPTNILDIGTGTGLLAMMLHQKYPQASITALEIEENAFAQAQENIENNFFNEKISLLKQSVQDFVHQSKQIFNLIVCNPPFYKNHLLSENEHRNIALHQQTLSLEELAHCISQLLAAQGLAYILLPPYPMHEFLNFAEAKGLFPVKILEIYHSQKHQIFRYIIAFGFFKTSIEPEKLYIKNTDENYTEQFRELLKDYYLAF